MILSHVSNVSAFFPSLILAFFLGLPLFLIFIDLVIYGNVRAVAAIWQLFVRAARDPKDLSYQSRRR